MKILVTGGAGYIGSHTCVELLAAGHEVVVFDNFSNSQTESVRRAEVISGKAITLIKGDIRDERLIERTLREEHCDAVIHFAGLKAVGESVEQPLKYYDNNVIGTCRLLSAMQSAGVNTIVFSSSATVYGDPQYLPIDEEHPLSATNPYGRSKIMIEEILRDCSKALPQLRVGILRYFNPVGAHDSGTIGEDPLGIPNNLMPFVAQVAIGRHAQVNIWGNDYDTVDGTGVRDYIHVVDLAIGHVKALECLTHTAYFAVNLGTGNGSSVVEVINAFKAASGEDIPYAFAPRRPGDIASCYADPTLSRQLLGWQAERDIDLMCEDHWRWQQKNPKGFGQD